MRVTQIARNRPITVIPAMTPYTSAPLDDLSSARKRTSLGHGPAFSSRRSLAALSQLRHFPHEHRDRRSLRSGLRSRNRCSARQRHLFRRPGQEHYRNELQWKVRLSLLSGSPTVDFARFNGLQTLRQGRRRALRFLRAPNFVMSKRSWQIATFPRTATNTAPTKVPEPMSMVPAFFVRGPAVDTSLHRDCLKSQLEDV